MAGIFDTMFGGGAEREAADRNRALTGQYGTETQGYLKTGYDTGVANLDKAVGAYAPLAALGKTYSSGANTLMGALGIGSPQQVAAARGAYQTQPGYGFQQDAMAQALARQRASGGMGNSGNADIDAMTYAHGLSDQDYQKWITNLSGVGGMGLNATSGAAAGQAAGYGNLANLANKYANDQSAVAGNQLSSNINSSNTQAQGEASGAKNLLGAGLSLASMAAGLPPGTLGGLGSALGGGGAPGAVGPTSVGGSQGFSPLQQPSLFNRMIG